MKNKIGIIDYGTNNIFNLANAFKYINSNIQIIEKPGDMNAISHLVLPGVGAFKDGFHSLKTKSLLDIISNHITHNLPFLGICLGMQMMLEMSYEFGEHKGLGIISGDIQKIPSKNSKGEEHKIPHIGWNNLHLTKDENIDNSILDSNLDNQAMYFVHSYMANCSKNNVVATCNYNGIIIPAVIRNNNSFGCQFHPEKSGTKGLSILTNFINL